MKNLASPPSQIAYHGSPYRFDSFSLDSVGSGEGAQAFGWGIYFGGAVEVARNYSGEEGIGGSPVPTFYEIDGVRTERGTPQQKAADLIFSAGLAPARKLATEMLQDARNEEEWTQDKGFAYYQKVHEITHQIQRKSQVKKAAGVLYQVFIPTTDEMLDWDAPLTEQNSLVIEALGRKFTKADAKGADAYKCIVEQTGSTKAASEYLLSLGIAGIYYRDGYSRGSTHGTRNFVVFDDTRVSIEKVYDQQKQEFLSIAKPLAETKATSRPDVHFGI